MEQFFPMVLLLGDQSNFWGCEILKYDLSNESYWEVRSRGTVLRCKKILPNMVMEGQYETNFSAQCLWQQMSF